MDEDNIRSGDSEGHMETWIHAHGLFGRALLKKHETGCPVRIIHVMLDGRSARLVQVGHPHRGGGDSLSFLKEHRGKASNL